MNNLPIHAIRTMQELGYTVYLPTGSLRQSYALYVKDGRVGYVEYRPFDGYTVTTVHKPHSLHGTGFEVVRHKQSLTAEDLECGLAHAPFYVGIRAANEISKPTVEEAVGTRYALAPTAGAMEWSAEHLAVYAVNERSLYNRIKDRPASNRNEWFWQGHARAAVELYTADFGEDENTEMFAYGAVRDEAADLIREHYRTHG